jgi:hypothetical protein
VTEGELDAPKMITPQGYLFSCIDIVELPLLALGIEWSRDGIHRVGRLK